MIPRLLVPFNARPPAADAPTTRRRPSTLDERTLVPAMLPIVPLDGRTNIPSSLPLESIAARIVVPRDLRREDFAVEEASTLPLQPTDLDERITVPQGAAPPEIITPSENIPTDIVDLDIFMTGEVNLLTEPRTEQRAKADLARNISSVVLHILLIIAIIVEPKVFPARPKTQAELDLARRQMTILLPPGAFETPRPAPRIRERPPEAMKVDPRILRRVAPPEPQPTPAPAPKEPERVVKELPNAPKPQPNATPPPEVNAPVAKAETPKQPLRLEKPEEQPRPNSLLIPKTSPGSSIRDSMREAAKMNAPTPIGGGGQIPSRAVPGAGGQGSAYAGIQMLTPTEGVDFNDYLARVYQSVKRNWFAVMPASVELGDKGVVSLQFRIMKDGVVPTGEPVKVFGSGKEPLDRAAISSIRASTPFEPLPPAFSGPFIELRFTYYYNLQPDYAH